MSVTPRRLWLVEDDSELSELVTEYLTGHGFSVRTFADGRAVVAAFEADLPDLLILDVMLPGLDGFEVCRRVRARWAGPVLMLTARTEAFDEVVGLELGADDYLKKPVVPRVLLARVQAHLRRSARPLPPDDAVTLGTLVVDPRRRDAFVDGQGVGLTTAEFDLLWLLSQQAGRVVSREHLHQALRGIEYDGVDRTIDVRVTRVRRKLGAAGELLVAVRGTGYQMTVPQ